MARGVFRSPVSSSRHITRSVRITRTTRSCMLHDIGLWSLSGRGGGPLVHVGAFNLSLILRKLLDDNQMASIAKIESMTICPPTAKN